MTEEEKLYLKGAIYAVQTISKCSKAFVTFQCDAKRRIQKTDTCEWASVLEWLKGLREV